MNGCTVVEARRHLTAAEATALVGGEVPQADPNITTATIAVDADTREPVFAYLPCPDVAALRRAVMEPEYSYGVIRASGYTTRSRTFGYRPRRPIYQKDACSPTMLAAEHPAAHAVIAGYADTLAAMLAEIDPTLPEKGRAAVAEVHGDWMLGESKLWTSGVINQSAILPWHRDAFNFPAWSAMPVLRRGMTGGYLRIPEYDATIACRDGWALFFPGYQLVHGVTPMSPRRPDGYRYSVVYYALKGMKSCFEYAAETAYAQRRRTEREQDIARRLAAGDTAVPGHRTDGSPSLTGDPAVIEDAYVASTATD